MPKGLYKVAPFFAMSLTPPTPSPLNNVEKTAEMVPRGIPNGDGQVEASQVMTKYFRRSPILSERSLHNFGGSLLLLSPSAPPCSWVYTSSCFYQWFPLPPSSAGHLFSRPLGRNPLCTSCTFCTQRVTTWTEPSIRSICSSIPLLDYVSF